MKKKHLCLVLTLIFALLLGGCASGETADKYVGDLITSIKKESCWRSISPGFNMFCTWNRVKKSAASYDFYTLTART